MGNLLEAGYEMGKESWGGWGKDLTGVWGAWGGERWSTDVWAQVSVQKADANLGLRAIHLFQKTNGFPVLSSRP